MSGYEGKLHIFHPSIPVHCFDCGTPNIFLGSVKNFLKLKLEAATKLTKNVQNILLTLSQIGTTAQ